MRRFRAVSLAAVIAVAAAPMQSAAPAPLQVLGTVTEAARPVANALVIALNLHDFDAIQTRTATDGRFTLAALPSGIYRIIAVKQGFAPAMTTIVPTQTEHKVALRLDSENAKKKKDVNQAIWELRGTLPPDILRELDFALAPMELAAYEIPRIHGQMLSLTGVANQPANPAYAQTAVGVQGRIGETWQLGITGTLQRFEDPTDSVRFGTPVAESSVMAVELRSSPTQAYRLASTASSWMYSAGEEEMREADVRAHNFEWQSGPARVQVRYFEQDNLFRQIPLESNLIEVAGNMAVVQTRKNDLAVGLRVTQESIDSTDTIVRSADISADGTVSVVPSVMLHYGMSSRLRIDGQELAPRAGAEWKLTENTSLIGSVLYKVIDRDASTLVMPSLVFWSEESRILPTYAYTFGIVTGKDGRNRFSAIATVSAIDDPVRVVFADEANQFWDGLYVESGDIRRDVRVAYRREFGERFAIDVATTAGTASNNDPSASEKVYVAGDLQSTFTPTRTSLAVSYRELQQPSDKHEDDYRTERIHVRMAQSLYLPVDVKLLLGLELARAENSPYLVDALTADGRSKKYIGGLALNF